MRSELALGLLLVAGLIVGGCGKSTEPEKPLVNRVYMPEQLEVSGGEHFFVPIYLENEVTLNSISLPLMFPSSIMRLDSVSLRDSRVAHFKFKAIFTNQDTISMGVVDDSAGVAAGSGLMALVYFWIHGNAPDTTFVFTAFDYWKPLSFFDSSLTPVENPPQLQDCQIHIKTILRP